MTIFLFGEDTYRSRRKLAEIKEKFLREVDPSGMNLAILEDSPSVDELRAAVTAMPFLAPKRLVIAKGMLGSAKKADAEKLAAAIAAVPEETILVLHEESGSEDLDGSPAFERLKGGKHYPEFKPLAPKQVEAWVREEAAAKKLAFTPDGLKVFLTDAGDDLWKLASDLDKLVAYSASTGKPADAAIVATLTERQAESDLFAFLDAVGARRADLAAQRLELLLEQGESEVGILNRLQSHIRNLLLCRELAAEGPVSKDRVAKELAIHPFVASKALSQSERFTSEELKRLYAALIEADARLKTGGWASPRMAIDMFLLELNKSSS